MLLFHQVFTPAPGFGMRLEGLTMQPFLRHVWLERDKMVCGTWGSLLKMLQPAATSNQLAYSPLSLKAGLEMLCNTCTLTCDGSLGLALWLFFCGSASPGPKLLHLSCEH
jgi:hypothetical protein